MSNQQAAWPEFEDEDGEDAKPQESIGNKEARLILSRQAFELNQRIRRDKPQMMASRFGLQSLFPGLKVK
jgi:uncharacterized protein YecT (DUF1311 family)